MIIKYGKIIFNGIAIGKIKLYEKTENKIIKKTIEDSHAEYERFRRARDKAIVQLKDLYEKAVREAGESGAEIFNVHSMMLADDDINDYIKSIIETQLVNAEFAVTAAGEHFAEVFDNMDDEYFEARSEDVKDITGRVINILSGNADKGDVGEAPVIIVAENLTPSEIVQMDKSRLLGFATKFGSVNSHTAILAKTMGIPAIHGVDTDRIINGQMAVLDGYGGRLLVEPDKDILEKYFEIRKEYQQQKELLLTLKNKENITKSGKTIRLSANIGNPGDVKAVLENDAGGIGLFRSEFLYLESDGYPTEEQQFQVYRQVLEALAGKKVIIRTLDIGADKKAEYFNLEPEENPALGYRAIRISLTRPEIFVTQLRALFRASAFGDLAIMYPMIISAEEVRRIRAISREVKCQLREEGIKIGNVEEGIMIETPAAALISGELAKEVDFFSIGTNDLTQYTLAIDRQNSRLEEFFNPHHPAVLRLIQMVVENAHRAGIRVGICGELGADMELTETFIKMGVDELSVSPAYILPIRNKIRECE